MAHSWSLYFWYMIAAVAAAAPIPFIKQWTEDGRWFWLALSAISYAVLILAYTVVLRAEDIAIVYPLLKVLSVLVVVTAGLLAFGSRLTLRVAAGIALGIGSIYLLAEAR